MKPLYWFIAGVATLWVVGRASRFSDHHPANALRFQLSLGVGNVDSPSVGYETAQFGSTLVAGEGGGE